MKLITKLTWWYLALTVFVLIAGGLLIIITVQREVDEEISMRLKALSVDIKDQIENGISISEITNNHIIVKEVENPNAKLPFQYIDTSAYYSPSVGEERMLIARAIYPINGKKYFVEVSEFLIEKGEVVCQSIRKIFSLTCACCFLLIFL